MILYTGEVVERLRLLAAIADCLSLSKTDLEAVYVKPHEFVSTRQCFVSSYDACF